MTRVIPQQPAVRTMFDRLTLLRIGAQQRTSSRGWASWRGGLVAQMLEFRIADCQIVRLSDMRPLPQI